MTTEELADLKQWAECQAKHDHVQAKLVLKLLEELETKE